LPWSEATYSVRVTAKRIRDHEEKREMTRIRPDERKSMIRDRAAAWAALLEHGSEVFDRMQYQLALVLGRSVKYVGEPFSGTWHAGGYFLGRQATDFIEEVEAGLLEAAAHGMEIQEETKGNVNTILSKVIHDALQDELEYWKETSAGELGPDDVVPILREDEVGAGVYEGELEAPDPLQEPHEGVDEALTAALTEEEQYALTRKKLDGASLTELAEDLDTLFPRFTTEGKLVPATRKRVRVLVDRAVDKARGVLRCK